jgi:UDP-glucose 4-epimerase
VTQTVFVTGAAGFIGRHVSRELAQQGWRVIGIGHGDWQLEDVRSWGLSAWKQETISLETLEALALKEGEPTALIHCAGSSGVPFSLSQPREDFLRTVASSVEILEFARRRAGVIRVVYPSSAAVYGIAKVSPIREDTPLCPISPYGLHKRMVENLCSAYAFFWNVPVAVIRLFSVYGAGLCKQLLWDACMKAQKKEFIFCGTGCEVRDWIHISDVAKLLAMAIDRASPNCPTVNWGSGQGIQIRSLLEMLGALWDGNLVPIFTGEKRTGDPGCYVADLSNIKAWGLSPQITLEQGIASYIHWFRSKQIV